MARTPLFTKLRRLYAALTRAREAGISDPAGVAAIYRRDAIDRRDLLRGAAATAALGAVPSLPACRRNGDDDTDPTAAGDVRIAIVGAGIAGLHCAWRLAEVGVDAIVYEANTRVGGRMYTGRGLYADGQLCELGGELIDSNHATLWALADELGIALDDRFAGDYADLERDTWWANGARVSDEVLAAQFTEVAPIMADAVERTDADEAAFEALDATSLADWLAEHVPPDTYPELHAILTAAYRGEYGLECEEQSAFNLIYLIDYEVPDPFRIFGDSDERWHTHDGNDTFPTALAALLADEQLVLDARLVAAADADGGGYRLTFESAAGDRFEETFDHVVFALPFSVLREVDLSGLTLSDEKRDVIANLGYGTNAKIMGGFTSRVWKTDHAAAGSLTTDLPAQQTWETTIGQDGASGILTNFLGGTRGLECDAGTADDQFRAALPDVEIVWPGVTAAYVDGSAQRMHWPTVPTAKGSYTCYRPGQWAYWSTEGTREGNLHFCGEHCSLDFQGWMEGAAETGALVAAEILDDLGVARSERHERIVARKLLLPQACYHGDRGPRLRWTQRRRLARALVGERRY